MLLKLAFNTPIFDPVPTGLFLMGVVFPGGNPICRETRETREIREPLSDDLNPPRDFKGTLREGGLEIY